MPLIKLIFYLQEEGINLDKRQKADALRLIMRFNGLGDIICNHITERDFLRNPQSFSKYKSLDTVSELIHYSGTHILNINSFYRFFQLIVCLILGYYPESPLSLSEQGSLNYKNKADGVLRNLIDKMQPGDYYKVCTVEKQQGIITGGHSMLLYKQPNGKCSFFDPNTGLQPNISTADILKAISEVQERFDHQEVAVMDKKIP